MKTIALFLLLFFSLFYAPAPAAAEALDQLLSALVIGTWEEGDTPYGIVTFKTDGSYQAKMFETKKQEKLLLRLEGTWTIKESVLQSVLTASSSPRAPVGETFADKIVQINRTELVLIGVEGRRYSKFRVTPETTE